MPKSESRDYYESYEISRSDLEITTKSEVLRWANHTNHETLSPTNERSPRNIFEILSCSWALENFSHSGGLRTDISQKTVVGCPWMISGRRIFFLPSPSPLFFFRPRTYRKGYYFYSPQSSTVIKSKMATTIILRTRTRFRPPKIRLHCRLFVFSRSMNIACRSAQNTAHIKRFWRLHIDKTIK